MYTILLMLFYLRPQCSFFFHLVSPCNDLESCFREKTDSEANFPNFSTLSLQMYLTIPVLLPWHVGHYCLISYFSICFVNTSYCSPQLFLHKHTHACARQTPVHSQIAQKSVLGSLSVINLYFLLRKFIYPSASMLLRCHNIQSYASTVKFSLDSDPWSQTLTRHGPPRCLIGI